MKQLTKQNFEETVKEGLHLIDFWAVWCGPCRMQEPILDELEKELPSIQISKVNVDEEPELSAQFGIQSIPTMLIFLDGRLVDRLSGVRVKEELKKELAYYM
ncbi:thioredoxin [Enterococcus olivae]